MTFSTDSVCDAVRETFTPVWESVSPTTVAEFQLGEGRSVEGTVGGEIMLYFCRPDGMVFNALPALQSPAVVKQAIERAATFWNESGGAPEEAIREYTEQRMDSIAFEQGLSPAAAQARIAQAHEELKRRLSMGSDADDAMSTALLSKVMIVAPAETVTVVEPGGLWLYALQTYSQLTKSPLQSPMQWKEVMFEGILDQPLKGGKTTYDPNGLTPMQLMPEKGPSNDDR